MHPSTRNAEYVDYAVRHVLMRQGVLGVKVKIMLPYDPQVRFTLLSLVDGCWLKSSDGRLWLP
jgi:ribosomal protein S3